MLYTVFVQTFTVSEPVWLKYLQFHFISHHGSEPICALNDILVFGKSAAEDLEDQLSDEALAFTEDSRAQQPNTALDASASADRQHAQIDMPGKLEGSASGAAEPDLSSEEAVKLKHSNAAVEANAGETANKSSAWGMLMSGKAASDTIRELYAAEQASAGPHSGQQQLASAQPLHMRSAPGFPFPMSGRSLKFCSMGEFDSPPSYLCFMPVSFQCRLTQGAMLHVMQSCLACFLCSAL